MNPPRRVPNIAAAEAKKAAEQLQREEEEDKLMIQLQAKWDDLQGASCQTRRHQKVIVLMLYWNKVNDSSMDVGDEIRRLEDVFTNKYHYTVRKQSLNDPADAGKNAQVSLQKHLSDAVYEADGDENALLIIYYAGHGNPNTDGHLVLTGGNYDPNATHPGSMADAVVWQKAEELMHTAGRPDMLLIFDCCYAGGLAAKFRRSKFSTRNFEFLGATTAQGLTRIPGPFSFTSALIWALYKLASDKGEFTTSQLYHAISQAPNFPKDSQTPILTEKGEPSLTRLCLAPLLPEGRLHPDENVSEQTLEDGRSFQFGLCLQFTYDSLPSLEDIEDMVKGLREMQRVHDVKAKHINWKGIHRRNQSMYDMPSLFLEAVAKFKRPLARKRSQNSISNTDESMIASLREPQRLRNSQRNLVKETPTQRVINGRISKPQQLTGRRKSRRKQ